MARPFSSSGTVCIASPALGDRSGCNTDVGADATSSAITIESKQLPVGASGCFVVCRTASGFCMECSTDARPAGKQATTDRSYRQAEGGCFLCRAALQDELL